jgi:hypothetical protein
VDFSFISRANGVLLICVITLSLVLSYPLEPRNSFVADSGEDLLWNLFEDSADFGKNAFPRARCGFDHLGLQVTKQEEVAGCPIWRMSRIGNPFGFG